MLETKVQTYDKMKDSGVEWLGEIPEHWEVKPLRFLAKIQTGSTPSRENESYYSKDLGTPWVKPDELNMFSAIKNSKTLLTKKGSNEARIVPKNSILVCCIGTIGKIGVAGIALATNQQINAIIFNNVVFSLFQKYLIYSSKEEHEKLAVGNVVNILNTERQKSIRFAIPSLPEQKAIADFLDKKTSLVDEAVSVKEQQIKLLKERKQILIQNAVTQGLNPNAPMHDSGVEWIGRVPVHWAVTRVKNVFRLVMEPSEINNDHELLSIYTAIGVRPRKDLEEKGNKASTTDGYWLVKKGDFIVNKLLAWMGAIGISEYEGVTSPAYDILRATKPLDGYFYHYLFRTSACSEELKTYSRGIMEMRLRLYFDKFGVVEVPYPPKEEQTAIVAHIEKESAKIDQAIDLNQQQIEKLKEYKATLINSAVTGKIKVV